MKTEKTHRLKLLADALGTSINRLEKEIGVPTSSLAAAVRRGSRISLEIATKVKARYPHINDNWLITGVGEMFLPATQQKGTEKSEWKRDENFRMPTREELINDIAATRDKGASVDEMDVAYQSVKRMQRIMLEVPLTVILSEFDRRITTLEAYLKLR